MVRRLNAVAKPSWNLTKKLRKAGMPPEPKVVTFCEKHCWKFVGLESVAVFVPLRSEVIRPFWTKATVCCGLLMGSEVAPLTEITSITGVGGALAPATPRAL